MLARWTRAVIHWRRAIVVGWVVVLALGVFASTQLSSLLSTSLAVPGSSSAQANTILVRNFHENVEGTFTVVVPLSGQRAQPASVVRSLRHAATAIPTASLTQEKVVGHLLYANIATTLNLQRAAAATATLRHALRAGGLTNALVTGPPAFEHDIAPVLARDLRRGELLALGLALILLTIVLGVSWALVVPFLVALSTTGGAIAIIYLLAHHLLMVLYIPNVVELIGLGLAIDYSLLIVHRFRTELTHERDVNLAVEATMVTAGRTVMISGLAFAIGLATMMLVPVPFVRSLGVAGLVVPIVSVAAALTLQPALLSMLGRAAHAHAGYAGVITPRSPLAGAWARVTRGVVRRPLPVLLAAALALGTLGASLAWFQLTPGSLSAVPANLESSRALTLVRTHVGPGVITPIEIVIDTGRAHRSNSSAVVAARLRLARDILVNPEVAIVAIDTKAPYVDATGRYTRVMVVARHAFGAETTQHLVDQLRTRIIPRVHFPPGVKLYLGGAPAQGVDFLRSVYGAFPWIVLVALALAYLVLARAFRSLLLALVAVVLDLVSVAVAYGVLCAVFRFGVGSSILHTYRVSQIEGWVPIFLFAMLFGLSMDYEVFIVTRIREAFERGEHTNDAIVEGLAYTGGVVTSAAVILVGALCGLVFGHVAGLQELGVGLAAGVLIDATIVRGLVLPAAMALLGRWNWWLPRASTRTH
ncbi:MAG TPA: MMPL family transporter [Acidimicrobiales bacterium]|nr:MMPL family transporter [Acidimicrobiales bacterium]